MELNANKCKLLNVMGKLTHDIYVCQEIKPTESQKELGIIITSNVSWQVNCNHTVQKQTTDFFQIKKICQQSAQHQSK